MLGALVLLGAGPAAAQDSAIWSADLTPRAYGTGQSAGLGCSNDNSQGASERCDNPGTLSRQGFWRDGLRYAIYAIAVLSNGTLRLQIDATDGGPFNNGTLHIGSSSFALPASNTSNGSTVTVTWANSGLSLTAGTKVRVSLELTRHGAPPAKARATKVAASTSATTLGFRISCGLYSGGAPGTDYILRLSTETQSSTEYLRASTPYPAPGRGCGANYTWTGLKPGTTYKFSARVRNLFARYGPWSEEVEATTTSSNASAPTVSLSASPNPVAEGSDVKVTATLSSPLRFEATIPLVLTHAHGTAEDGDYGSLASITIPAGFSSATGTITTNQDTDTDDETFTVVLDTANLPSYVDTGSPSSTAVTVTITDDDASGQQTTGTLMGRCAAHLPANAVSVAEIRRWRDAHAHVASHVERWNRVLRALGAPDDPSATPLTVAESRANERRYMPGRWSRVTGTLEGIETCLGGETRELPATTPEVSIAAGNAVTEGESATFTVTANPAPSAALTVGVTVTESGGYATAGTRQVTVPTGGTATFTVATVGDTVDEPDGSVTATLAAGAGYTVSSSRGTATVAVADDDGAVAVPDIVTPRWSTAREGTDDAIAFPVRLSGAATDVVTVDYATADGASPWLGQPPATAGADYTATSGTLSFAPGESEKTVRVAILDDAIDEGGEHFLLRFSNPQGATLASSHRETVGLIRNSDPLPKAYLGYFGRRVASDAIAAVTARFETPRDAGSHFTLAGQRLSGDGAALADAVAGLARAFGAEEAAPAATGDPFARHGPSGRWNNPASATGRSVSARELLMGTSFRAVLGQGTGAQLTSWGQGASVSHFSSAARGLSLSGEAATGALGMDYERGRLLTGFALTHSLGAGTAQASGQTYAMGSTVTTVLPYARFSLTPRISAWTLAGTGSGGLTLDVDDDAQRYRTDLSMTLAAAGVRGDLVTPAETSGFALALKADAFWVRTESDAVRTPGVWNLAAARADATRLRAVLDGKRTFSLAGGATLAPSLELGVRHDGGDAGTGTGLELGAGLGYADPSRGLDMALRVYGLAAHAEDGYREWGVSGSLRLVPGGSGRGLSMSLTPSYGVDREDAERLWTMPDASGLAANDEATASSRLDTELGYGLPVFGGGFTATPYVGYGLSEAARDWRLGWRLTSAVPGGSAFEVNLDATRREAANDEDAEHAVMLRGAVRW